MGEYETMFLWIHLIFAVLLIVLVITALCKKNNFKPYMMATRVSYLVFIVTGIVLFSKAFERDAMFTILKALSAIFLIGLIEMAYAQKTKKSLTVGLVMSLILVFALVIVIGLIVAGGRPFIHFI